MLAKRFLLLFSLALLAALVLTGCGARRRR